MPARYEAKANDGGTAHDVPLRRLQDAEAEDCQRLLNDEEAENDNDDYDNEGRGEASLPPTDRGRAAWLCLLGCWILEAAIGGFALSFGVFQRYYSAHALFRAEGAGVATVGALATGVRFLGVPVMNYVAVRWPAQRRRMCVAGWGVCVAALAAASLASSVRGLVWCQGLLYGVGWSVCSPPALFVLDEWWVRRRGFAYGVLGAASGVSGLLIPVAMDAILNRWGFRVALRSCAAIIFLVSGPGLLLIQPRHPTRQRNQLTEKPTASVFEALRPYLTNFHFLLLAAAVFLQGLAFFLPNMYIPEMAKLMGISSPASAGLLSLIALSQVAGQIWQSWASDHASVYVPAAVSALYSAVSAFFLWGWAKGLPSFIPFAILWGFFSASYSVLYARMVGFLLNGERRDGPTDERVDMLLYGFFSFVRGLAAILAGPVSGWLKAQAGERVYWDSFGLGRYQYVIGFTVVCMALSSLVGVGWRYRHVKHPGVYVNR